MGLANTQVDYDLQLRRPVPRRRLAAVLPFTINTAHSTTNAGMIAVSCSAYPTRIFAAQRSRCSWASESRVDARPWWNLKHEEQCMPTATPGRLGPGEHAVFAGRESLEQFQALEPTFRDIQAGYL